jgi:hypothetical protein
VLTSVDTGAFSRKLRIRDPLRSEAESLPSNIFFNMSWKSLSFSEGAMVMFVVRKALEFSMFMSERFGMKRSPPSRVRFECVLDSRVDFLRSQRESPKVLKDDVAEFERRSKSASSVAVVGLKAAMIFVLFCFIVLCWVCFCVVVLLCWDCFRCCCCVFVS